MNLENKFAYRLIRLSYYVGIILCTIIFSSSLYDEFVDFPIDNNRSYVSCNNGKKYLFKDIHINLNFFWSGVSLDDDDTEKAKKNCQTFPNNLPPELEKYKNNNEIDWDVYMGTKNKYTSDYSLVLMRDWFQLSETTLYTFFNFLIVFFIINIIQEALLYLFFGKRLTWKGVLFFKK